MSEIQRKVGSDVVRGYEEYAHTPHGRLRHDLLSRLYTRFLRRHPVSWMLDVGCGTGLLIGDLARGFDTCRWVLVDDDGAMIDAARQRLAGVPGVETLMFSHDQVGDIIAQRKSWGGPLLVAFNHVIEYVEDQTGALSRLAQSVMPGSYLGIMFLNNSHEALRRVWHKDSIVGFLTQLETGDFDAVNFGMARAITTTHLHDVLTSAGLHLLEEFGLRCFSEWKSKEFIEDRYAEVLDAEERVASHPDFIGLARYRLRYYWRPKPV